MLTSLEAQVLTSLLQREYVQFPVPGQVKNIHPGDLVQLHPFASEVFGGMLAVVTQADPYCLRGYLLRPHRGGCREAWLGFHRCDVEPIGRILWPDVAGFSRRAECWRPECERYHERF